MTTQVIALILAVIWGLMNISTYRETWWCVNWQQYTLSRGKIGIEALPMTIFYLPCAILKG